MSTRRHNMEKPRRSKVAIFTTRWAAGRQNGYGGVNGTVRAGCRCHWKPQVTWYGWTGRPADHNTERQNPHPDDLSAGASRHSSEVANRHR
ncbi:hypothetical protein ACVXHB_26380 [Escherichia coli]